MRIRLLGVVLGILLMLAAFPQTGTAYGEMERPLLILTDVSGSMQKKMKKYKEAEEAAKDQKDEKEEKDQEEIKKVYVLKELLGKMSRELALRPCPLGIYRVRYIAGNKTRYVRFLDIDRYDPEELAEKIEDDFEADYPRFNRRTPLADMFRQLDENELQEMEGNLTLVLLSDGRESFYDLDEDTEKSRKDEVKSDDPTEGPLTEVRRLKEMFGQRVTLHTVFIGDTDEEKRESADEVKTFFQDKTEGKEAEGENLLHRMAYMGQGRYYRGTDLLEKPVMLREFCALLCPAEPARVEMPAKEAPQPEALPPVVAGPSDRDGDGIYDTEDQCPDTPRTAQVNPEGCWELSGVLFDTDKWDIRPRFRADLDEVARVMKENPGLKLAVQGHTDSRASAAYNQTLSRKRARAVRDYLIERGVEPARLSPEAYGLTRPTASNATSRGRTLNRRTVLVPVPGKPIR